MTAGDSERRDVATLGVITSLGETTHALDRAELSVGRSEENDVRIDADVVSSVHARLVREGPTYRFIQLGETNPTLLRGAPVADYLLHHGDRLEIAPGTAGAVTLTFELPHGAWPATLDLTMPFKVGEGEPATSATRLVLPRSGTVGIGRSRDNDLVLSSLSVSRSHARVEVTDGALRLEDAGSANGTYVNGLAVQSRQLAAGDIVRIGPYKLVYQDGALEGHDDSQAVRLDAHNVSKRAGDRTILNGISFNVQPGEVMAVAGTSGAGKSTLLDALNGSRPPTSGNILVNGADLYRAYDALRPLIGYVPQDNILPMQLTVRRALHYVAGLRLPPDVSAEDAERRVEDVIEQLDLQQRRDVAIGRLSGGQQKRASIAAELIASPGLFFLDEPTSGLDPGLTRRVTRIIRDLGANGSTVVIISHDVESLEAADRLVFLSGGRVVFIGTPSEARQHFGVGDFAEIYQRVESEDAEVWEERFRDSELYQRRVAPTLIQAAPLEAGEPTSMNWDPVALFNAGAHRGSSAWRQFVITTTRYAEGMLRDTRNLGLLLVQAPIIALLLTLVAKPTDFQPPPPEAVAQAASFGIPAAKLASALPIMLAATATWFGAINAAREIVKELPILLRERLAGLRVAPYLASKHVVLTCLCLVQTLALLGIVALKVELPTSGAIMWGPLELWISLVLAALAALGLGLLISASMSNADRAQSLVPIVLIPQLIFVGGPGTGTLGQWISYLMVTHWAVEAMKITAGIPYDSDGGGFGAADLLERWAALVVMALVFVALTGWQLVRRRSGT